jgi:segregation and condensation protein A
MDEYQVALPSFHGPLDLLLYLVKKNEVDVRDIPIAVIADQFAKFLDVLKLIDVEMVGDFLVTAATLAEIKSRMVLPNPETAVAEVPEDPRRELVQQLLDYRRFKEAAARLEARALDHDRQLPRGGKDADAPGLAPSIQSVELWDLVSAFARLVQEAEALAPDQIVNDDTPQQVYQEQVLAKVRANPGLAFEQLFDRPYYRLRLIGVFLALLEVIRAGMVQMAQPEAAGSILLYPVDPVTT